MAAISLTGIEKAFAPDQKVLRDVHLSIEDGERVVLVGPSGSGKSTLLYLLGALDRPSSGTVKLDGEDPFTLDDAGLASFRNRRIGFVFQDHALLPQCSVLENVLIPTLVGERDPGAADRARQLLGRVGLSDRIDHRPSQLSGGERQRAAIARALIRQPQLLLCDEPTGNLDQASTDAVADLLFELHAAQKTVMVVVTHSAALAARFPVCYQLQQRTLIKVK